MKIFGYKITDTTKDYESYDWIYLLPSIEYKKKYWYLRYIVFSWLWWRRSFEILSPMGNEEDK